MSTDRSILIAFILNISFTVFEIVGGLMTNSVAILSDAVHDLGDALSIGISYFLERKANRHADNNYTYGYLRYSVLGGLFSTTVLAVGSCLVISSGIERVFHPQPVDYNGMMLFAVVGVVVNFLAAYSTKEGRSVNQKSVNLHMLEDVLGWVIVLIGSLLMRFTDLTVIDPLMSIGVAGFILVSTLKNFQTVLDLFLEKKPQGVDLAALQKNLLSIAGVMDVHHVHVWSLDLEHNYATMHVVTKCKDVKKLKARIRELMERHGIAHTTIEIETERCEQPTCELRPACLHSHHHHHGGH